MTRPLRTTPSFAGRLRARGFTMIEMLAVLALAAILVTGIAVMANSALEDTRGQQAALYQSQLVAAATQLIEQNFTALSTQANASTPVVAKLTGTPLQMSTYLPSALSATNAYGQTPCLLIYGTDQPGALQALLVTEGGTTIPDPELGYIAGNAGAGGGSIQAANNPSGAANGAFGSWKVTTPNPAGATCSGTKTGVGHVASLIFYNGTQTQNADFLYRVAVPGNPAANTMQVPIVLAQQTDYADCSQTGAIAADSTGNVLSCTGSKWTPQASLHWREPVANAAALPSSASSSQGDVRMTLATNRAYTFNGTDWQALAVDEAGNLALGNAQTLGAACPAQASGTTLVSTDATGRVLSCRNGTWQAQAEINPQPFPTDTDCAVQVGQSGTSDFPCGTQAGAITYDDTMGYYQSVVTRNVPQLPANGALSVYAWSHLNDAFVTSCPSAPQDLTGGSGGYVTLLVELLNLDLPDGSNVVAKVVNQSSRVRGDLANVPVNMTNALPLNKNGYQVRLTTFWILYGSANPASFQPSYCGTGNNIFPATGVVTSWNITPTY
ncbi:MULTISPECIES: shufflon system plasmid conjugative transfer pilus tip adhesin PilV [Burkholderiaceae]|uniref:shufflon system plasmid conjugative transfer pilus tip adhesin PilV n=1 Tax=Burkholderiaceae TaxID=119060 RepID=UPI00141F3012|nr:MULTISPECIES: shufflon system plasmid conjugative transfer pilus tip adhesin PilV [Burkholderiaceae]MBN3851546.1 shufflon system plasmid conjugative transfer pilus tip adhesin PilV [Paraburkholderia sp. Ac-20342]NIF54079.1 shufflon system plasmid conjugative transfer pilus tip adhesin PilV [Burkholderia sp. Ax-1724]